MSEQPTADVKPVDPKEAAANAAALAAYEKAQNPDAASEEQPTDEMILGKFKSQEDLVKAYQELERKLHTPKDEKSTEETPPADTPEIPEGDKPDEETPAEGLIDFASYTQQFASEGKLTDENYAELESKGIPRHITDVYLQGLRAMQKDTMDSVYGSAGGADNYKAMTEWAKTNLSDAEREAYNTAVSGSNPASRDLAVRGLFAKYSAANPKPADSEPSLMTGGSPAASSAGRFTSWSEVQEAMKDKRYLKDRGYTNQVQQKMAASNF